MAILVAALLAAVAAPAVGAQEVRGIVLFPDRATPAAAVLVELVDMRGAQQGRTTTSAAGRFALAAPSPGRYVVRALRIGYRPSLSAELDVGSSAVEVSITLGEERVALEAIQVRGRSACRPVAGGGAELVTVWEEARKALAYASITAEQRRHQLSVATFERELEREPARDGGGVIVVREALREAETNEVRAFRSVGADALLRDGFVVQRGDALDFFGPDADLLLSDAFVASHCLRLVDDPLGDTAAIAIAFEPAARREVIGVQGTLTLTRATSELRRLAFGYVGLPDEAADAGGELTFTRVDDGGWMVQRWAMLMPELAVETGGVQARGGAARRDRVEVRALHATGGEVLRMMHDDREVFRAALRQVQGRVVREDGATAVAGARITLQGTEYATTSDSTGAFLLEGVLPARYRLVAFTALLDSLGGVAPGGVVDLESGDVAGRTITMRGSEGIYRELCRVERDDRRGALLRITVRHAATGALIPNAGVQLRWGGVEKDGRVLGRQQERALETDEDGTVSYCGAPRAIAIRIRVTAGAAMTAEQEVTISALRPFMAREIRITPR